MKARTATLIIVILIAIQVSACLTPPATQPSQPTPLPPTEPAPTQPAPTATQPPVDPSPTTGDPTPASATQTTEPTPEMPQQPPDSERIEFIAEDSTPLVGTYYPVTIEPAPVVILMHQFGSDRSAWETNGLAPWLQDPSASHNDIWPQMPGFGPFSVFSFDFRGHGDSGGNTAGARSDFLMDAKAALETVKNLPGVDPERIVLMGASIGADAAIDVCVSGCLGAFSLSPGSYLDIPYAEVVEEMALDNKPAWCLAAEDDPISVDTCNSAAGESYLSVIYPSGGHGEMLVKPGMDPAIGQLMVDFLSLAYGLVP